MYIYYIIYLLDFIGIILNIHVYTCVCVRYTII